MKISTILDHIDSGYVALPVFQRGYVWNRDQVRGLMQSLYRSHPIGSLLVWVTESDSAEHRGDDALPPGVVKLLLDGQQRMTTLYGLARGRTPKFFDGNPQVFTGLHFHLDREEFEFYSPIKMKDDPRWIDVTKLLKGGNNSYGEFLNQFGKDPQLAPHVGEYAGRLNAILGILGIHLHVEEVTGVDKTVDIVVDIFNRVNSGGTKLSQGDLALAKICSVWPEARDEMKGILKEFDNAGFSFDLDWLMRSVNTVLTGEARFNALHSVDKNAFRAGLDRCQKSLDYVLNLVSGRLGLDHDRVLISRYAFPVMARYVDQRGGRLSDAAEQGKLLYWYLNSAMWGRFSGSTESFINQDINAFEQNDAGVDGLIREMQLWRGDLNVVPDHFGGWSRGARFYPILYMLTRVGEARDFGTGLPLKAGLLGRHSKLEVHHLFPKALLRKNDYKRDEVNAIANFSFLTKRTNLEISDKRPEIYFEEIERRFPGALASQWIPLDRDLWRVDRFPDFLEARRKLMAKAINQFTKHLLEGEMPAAAPINIAPADDADGSIASEESIPGSVETDEEEALINDCNDWVVLQGLPSGQYMYELVDPDTNRPLSVLDLAWPNGLQRGFSSPIALLIDEGPDTLVAANQAGFTYFTQVDEFQEYVIQNILGVNDDDTSIQSAETSREYLVEKWSEEIVGLAEQAIDLLNETTGRHYGAKYNRHYIGLLDGDTARRFVHFAPRQTYIRVLVKVAEKKHWAAQLEAKGVTSFSIGRHYLKFDLKAEQLESHRDLLLSLFRQAQSEFTQ